MFLIQLRCFYHEGCTGGRQDQGEAEYRRRRRRLAQSDCRGHREEADGESEQEEVAGGRHHGEAGRDGAEGGGGEGQEGQHASW